MNDIEEFGFDTSNLKTYSGYFYDSDELKTSASGGIATAIAEGFISNGGVVFGVSYSSDFRNAEYCCVERIEDLAKLKGSKYITSKKEILTDGKYVSVYKAIQEKLENGRKVLFIGLGCDVGAIHQYCRVSGIDTNSLYTIDLICYGSTSPKVAVQFLDELEEKYHSRVIDFSVRYKKEGWVPPYIHAVFESGEIYEKRFYETDYGRAFSVFSRPSCFQCKFRGEHHASDITIGDYWGMIEKEPEYNKYGVSIAFINHPSRGDELLNMIDRQGFYIQQTDTKRALRGNTNYYSCRTRTAIYENFSKNFSEHGLHYAVRRSIGLKGRIKGLLKTILP